MARAKKSRKTSSSAILLHLFGAVILIIAAALCGLLILPRLFGLSGYTVLSGSMEPTIPVGSVVYAAHVEEPASLEAGDIVIFAKGDHAAPVIHRVFENHQEENALITKGDANAAVDLLPVPYADIIGKSTLHIPWLGRILYPLGSLPGKLSLIALVIGGLLLCKVSQRLT